MIKLRHGSTISIEPKGTGLNIVLKSKNGAKQDGNKQEQTFTFALPMSMVPVFYGGLIGKNYFATKNNQQYSLVVMHTGMKRRSQQNKANETQSTATSAQSQQEKPSTVASMLPGADDVTTASTETATTVSQSTQNNTNTDAKEKQKQKDIELVNFLIYEKQEGGKTSPKYIARFTATRGNIVKIKQEVKKALKQADKWSLKMKSITITKAGPVIILTQNANQLILDYSNKDELKDELTDFIMSNREEITISRIKFTKDDAMTLLSLLTHMEI